MVLVVLPDDGAGDLRASFEGDAKKIPWLWLEMFSFWSHSAD